MKQEMYSNIIGREVWEKCQHCNIWENDYYARIEMSDCDLFRPGDDKIYCDKIDILYDSNLESGEIKGVWIVTYVDVQGCLGEYSYNLATLPIEQQKTFYDKFEKELAKMLA